jgi:hypothetical protein
MGRTGLDVAGRHGGSQEAALKRIAGLGLILSSLACGPTSQDKDLRVVSLTLLAPNSQDEALGGTRPVQLVAVQIEGDQVVKVTTSTPADPRQTVGLSVGVSKEHSVSLFLQTPRGNTSSLGQLVGRILWSSGTSGLTSRLVAGKADVDLGTLTFQTNSPSSLADNVLLVPDDHNPLRLTDRDGDGQSDLLDTDDDGDGILDATDPDADGDGLADLDQELASLPDRNGRDDADGVPDDVE